MFKSIFYLYPCVNYNKRNQKKQKTPTYYLKAQPHTYLKDKYKLTVVCPQ